MAILGEGPDRLEGALPRGQPEPVSSVNRGRLASVSGAISRGSTSRRSSPSRGMRTLSYAAPKADQLAKQLGVSGNHIALIQAKSLNRLQLSDLIKHHPELKGAVARLVDQRSPQALAKVAEGWKMVKSMDRQVGRLAQAPGEFESIQKELMQMCINLADRADNEFVGYLGSMDNFLSQLDHRDESMARELHNELVELSNIHDMPTLSRSVLNSMQTLTLETVSSQELAYAALTDEDQALLESHVSAKDLATARNDTSGKTLKELLKEVKSGVYGFCQRLGIDANQMKPVLKIKDRKDTVLLDGMSRTPEYQKTLKQALTSDKPEQQLKLLLEAIKGGHFKACQRLGLSLEQGKLLAKELSRDDFAFLEKVLDVRVAQDFLQETANSGNMKGVATYLQKVRKGSSQVSEQESKLQEIMGGRLTESDLDLFRIEMGVVFAGPHYEGRPEDFEEMKGMLNVLCDKCVDFRAKYADGNGFETDESIDLSISKGAFYAKLASYGLSITKAIVEDFESLTTQVGNVQPLQEVLEQTYQAKDRTGGKVVSLGGKFGFNLRYTKEPDIDLKGLPDDALVDFTGKKIELNVHHPHIPGTYTVRIAVPLEGEMTVKEARYRLTLARDLTDFGNKALHAVNEFKETGTTDTGNLEYVESYLAFEKEHPEELERIKKFADDMRLEWTHALTNFNSPDAVHAKAKPATKALLESRTQENACRAAAEGSLYNVEGRPSLLPPEVGDFPDIAIVNSDDLKALRTAALEGRDENLTINVLNEEGEALVTEGTLSQDFEVIPWGESGTQLLQMKVTFKVEGKEVTRVTQHELKEGETLEQAKERVVRDDSYERNILLARAKFYDEVL